MTIRYGFTEPKPVEEGGPFPCPRCRREFRRRWWLEFHLERFKACGAFVREQQQEEAKAS